MPDSETPRRLARDAMRVTPRAPWVLSISPAGLIRLTIDDGGPIHLDFTRAQLRLLLDEGASLLAAAPAEPASQ